jgi:hypothetical protein
MYPKYEEWMQVRETLDPGQVFVTPYWRKNFLIPTLGDVIVEPDPPAPSCLSTIYAFFVSLIPGL